MLIKPTHLISDSGNLREQLDTLAALLETGYDADVASILRDVPELDANESPSGDRYGRTLLMLAASKHCPETVEYLMAGRRRFAAVLPNLRDSLGRTALHLAADAGAPAGIAAALLAHPETDVNAR